MIMSMVVSFCFMSMVVSFYFILVFVDATLSHECGI